MVIYLEMGFFALIVLILNKPYHNEIMNKHKIIAFHL
ncbi:hypothetical protein CZ814_02746 [Photobacterium toruni]|uniref:Uncharacterized protein n=1 Tax=Photobacterium toruni TaxID=1935446 RepID=A0A1T4U646_9GAMM|nr:hypothetical protein CZ814_02746 [Photobacterium toruni]